MTSGSGTDPTNKNEPLAADLPQPLYVQLRERLRAQILDGTLQPLQRLPSEHEMVRQHGVSRITVRQALDDLQSQGLVVKVHGKGSFVAPPRVQQDLAQLRGLAESVAGSGRHVHTRVLQLRSVAADAVTAGLLRLPSSGHVVELATLRYLDRSPLSLNRTLIVPALGERLPRLDLTQRDLLGIYEQELGVAVGHAELEISATVADRDQARQLKVGLGSPLLCVRRIVYDISDQPLHVETSVLRSDEFSYRLRLQRAHEAG